jgi:transposase-like protein
VITGPERRRSWTEEQKRALVMEAFAPGAVVVDVARRADVSATLPSKDSEADSAFTWIGKLKF